MPLSRPIGSLKRLKPTNQHSTLSLPSIIINLIFTLFHCFPRLPQFIGSFFCDLLYYDVNNYSQTPVISNITFSLIHLASASFSKCNNLSFFMASNPEVLLLFDEAISMYKLQLSQILNKQARQV